MQGIGSWWLLGKKRLMLVVTFIVVAAGITLSFTLFNRTDPGNRFFTEPVDRGSIRTLVNATGNVQAVVTVQVGSQVSGQIEALYADYNSVVKRGQLLAKIDPRNFLAQTENAKANLAAAEAHVRSTQADLATQHANLVSANANLDVARVARDNDALILGRNSDLSQSGLIAQNDLDTIRANAEASRAKYSQALAAVQQAQTQINAQKAQVQQAEAQVMQARADLDRAQLSVGYCDIYSPIDGVVVSRSVDVGQTVAASLSAPLLFVIANDLTKMQVNASVDEADIGHISDNVDVKFTVDAYPNESFSGKITEIRLNPQTVQNVVTYSVIISVDNPKLRLKPGMTANITITVAGKDNALKIGNAALRYLPPGTDREQEAELLKRARGSESMSGSRLQPSRNSSISAVPGQPKTPSSIGKRDVSAAAHANGNFTAADHQKPTMGAAPSALAPGQLWNVADKIRFPAPPRQAVRSAIIWVLDGEGKPEAKTVSLGITDGAYTELVSGGLREGDRVIVADASQETPANGAGGVRSPLGLGPARRGR